MTAPLAGTTVVDTTNFLPGPYCSVTLADLGARIISVEPPSGDPMRDYDMRIYRAVNHNKETIRLDLKDPADLDRLYVLVAGADVFLEGMRPGVAARLGTDYESMRGIKPDLVYCSISGYGQGGHLADAPGHDINYQSLSGTLSIPGHLGRPAQRAGLPIGDLAASMYSCIGILAALRLRDQTGEGSFLDVAIRDAMASWMPSRVGDEWIRSGAPDAHLEVNNDIFHGSDGVTFSVGAVEQHFWTLLRDVVAQEQSEILDPRFDDRAGRREHAAELRAIFESVFDQRTGSEWLKTLRAAGVPVSPIYQASDVAADQALIDRGIVEQQGEGHFMRLPIVRDGSSWSVPFHPVAELDV